VRGQWRGNAWSVVTRAAAFTALGVSLTAVGISQLVFKARLNRLAEDFDAGSLPLATVWRALSDPLLWLAGLLVLVGIVSWYLAMVRLPLNTMLPLAASIAPVVSIGSYFILGEVLTPTKIAAILFIAAGVAWLGWLNT
jgi:drug/metabolite transporter (DMT)-like permease